MGHYLRDHDAAWNDVVADVISAGNESGRGGHRTAMSAPSELEALLSKNAGARFHVPRLTMVSCERRPSIDSE